MTRRVVADKFLPPLLTSEIELCASFVFSVSLWWAIAIKINHGDTENTETTRG